MYVMNGRGHGLVSAYAFGADPVAPPGAQPVIEQRVYQGKPYKALSEKAANEVRYDLVTWKIRAAENHGTTEIVHLTPYYEGTGPTDLGADGFDWTEQRRVMGRGILFEPPKGWIPELMLLGWKPSLKEQRYGSDITLIATEDPSYLEYAAPDGPAYVAYEPARGWGIDVGLGPPPNVTPIPGSTSTLPKWLVPAALAAAALGVAAYYGLKR